MKDLKKLIKDYLKEARLMQLATSVGNQSWVCSVWFAADADLNIYWFSSTTRKHSGEVLENNKVAGAIVLPQTPEDLPRGVQFQGTAELLENEEEIKKARSVYQDRIFPGETIDDLLNHPEKPHRFYKIKVSKFVLFDAVNFPDQSRQELDL
jgi:uncharacterized protein YhbP (UPF0306 family)